MKPFRILTLHGVNLNMFGLRDSTHYGTATLVDIDAQLLSLGHALGVEVDCFQSNHEGAMVERIHAALDDGTDGVIINAGAWTHYSYALRDALAILPCPIMEVHMSNIHVREPFRHHSVFDGVVMGQICGLGVESYLEGLRQLVARLQSHHSD